ncbi:hypothetical protein EDB86DRAFT_3084282 [Lactarius hatsudake]|nr:hypothetical protein EDB86DRAFT_3084282 [Lactarius hatsudake]
MAAPPGQDDRNNQTYSPSKLSALPEAYLTPSNDSLNNSGAYAPAILGPITASGYGPPARRDGQAYWNDSVPTPHPILVSSTSPTPAAGRSPQDSVMGCPESEEPTVPNLLTTQIGEATQDAIMAALPSAPTDSQQLWDNVPSLPADLPPQPEVIEVRGRTTPHSHKTPRPRSRALSNTSVWSHATVESNVTDSEEPTFPALAVADGFVGRGDPKRSIEESIGNGVWILSWVFRLGNVGRWVFNWDDSSPRRVIDDIDVTVWLGDSFVVIQEDLMILRSDGIGVHCPRRGTRDKLTGIPGLRGYAGGDSLHREESLSEENTKTKVIHAGFQAPLQTILANSMLEHPHTMGRRWLKDSHHSPGRASPWPSSPLLYEVPSAPQPLCARERSSLNGIDSFPLHKDVDHPLTEGGAIMLMCQQLEGLYRSNRNHPDKTFPDSYFDRLVTLLDSRMHQVPTSTATSAPIPLTEADRAQVTATVREKLILDGLEAARVDQAFMGEIRALSNIEDWRAIYKHEFTEAMHDAFEAQYPGIHPGKGTAKEIPPTTHSQVVREAQPHIQEEVRIQVNACIASIHEEIKESLANDDPFWKQGPLRETIAAELRTATTLQVQQELEQELQSMKTAAREELDAFKLQLQYDQDQAHVALHKEAREEYDTAKALYTTNLEADVKDFKKAINTSVKEWKDQFKTAHNLSALKREARRFGLNLVPTDEGSTAAEKSLFARYALSPLEVDGRDISVEPDTLPSRPITPTSEIFTTPPNQPTRLPDPNVTPTPVRVKRSRTEEAAVYPPLYPHLFAPWELQPPTPEQTHIPLPPPSPMEEDRDYVLEVLTDRLHQTGSGIHASVHAPPSGTHHPSLVHIPSALPQGGPLDAQSEGQPTAPSPVTLPADASRLEEPEVAHPTQTTDHLAAMLAAINVTILGLEARLTTRLDTQDKRIQALSAPSNPSQPVTAKRAKGQATVATVPDPNTPSSSSGAHETTAPVPRVDDPTPHDRIEEIQTPGVQASTSGTQGLAQKTHVVQEAFQPPPEKHVRLNVDSKGKPTPATSMPPSWAKITATSTSSKPQTGPAQPRTPPPKTQIPATKGRSAKTSGNTEVTINRHRGLEDAAFKATIRKMTLAAIIAETRTEIDRLTGGKIALLSGRWSNNPNKLIHNFVYTFKGQIPFKAIYPLRDILIRDTNTSDNSGHVYSNDQLENELRHNPAFEDAIFCITPHWQGSRSTVSLNPRGTVAFAYVDEEGRVTAQALRDGVFLFNKKMNFIPVGDTPTIIMCGQCHCIGHATDSTACPLPTNSVRCHICGGAHHSNDHAAHCPKPHNKGNHNARSPRCPLKKGFSPPDLADNPATSAAAPTSAKGKAKADASEHLVTTQCEPTTTSSPDIAPDDQFTVVTKKRSRKGKGKAKDTVAQSVQDANASVPGSSAAAAQSRRQTAKVPARPIYKPPTPPTWKEAPVIHKRHVATDLECAAALRRVFRREPTVDDLRSVHIAWGGHESDEEVTALWTLHFKWAVKYGLPLTMEQAKRRIVKESVERRTNKRGANSKELVDKLTSEGK